MRYVDITPLLRDESNSELRLHLLVPRIGPSRDPQVGCGQAAAIFLAPIGLAVKDGARSESPRIRYRRWE
ncbi:MAG: hypothetical protein A3F90_13260 [Deltaproteobacteria bacterium RIFCSPLOWO2_12_FULL_60_19]|nr:MAG: hypothetical protein A3F90_13260 [Deltaproteobacteria bacterium RIFCSPLOWO2_12_FULL_60_19]